jgi:voltage-gated cation channel
VTKKQKVIQNVHQMSDFIASLDVPLGIPKPNILALVSFDLPIAKGDKIHCLGPMT